VSFCGGGAWVGDRGNQKKSAETGIVPMYVARRTSFVQVKVKLKCDTG